jgi:hypothetical protein
MLVLHYFFFVAHSTVAFFIDENLFLEYDDDVIESLWPASAGSDLDNLFQSSFELGDLGSVHAAIGDMMFMDPSYTRAGSADSMSSSWDEHMDDILNESNFRIPDDSTNPLDESIDLDSGISFDWVSYEYNDDNLSAFADEANFLATENNCGWDNSQIFGRLRPRDAFCKPTAQDSQLPDSAVDDASKNQDETSPGEKAGPVDSPVDGNHICRRFNSQKILVCSSGNPQHVAGDGWNEKRTVQLHYCSLSKCLTFRIFLHIEF